MPLMNFSLNTPTPPVRLKVAIERRKLIGLARREAGADDRDLHRLFLKQRHAEVRSSTASSSLEGILDLFDALAGA